MKKTVFTRVTLEARKRLKLLAANHNMSMVEVVEELSKHKLDK